MASDVLSVRGLRLATDGSEATALVDGVELSVAPGEIPLRRVMPGERAAIVLAVGETEHKILGVDGGTGLSNVLLDQTTFEKVVIQTSVPNLDLLPSGRTSAQAHGLLIAGSHAMARGIGLQLRDRLEAGHARQQRTALSHEARA